MAADEVDKPNFVMGVVFDISQTDEKGEGAAASVEGEEAAEAAGM
jgi:hypothetical protein